MVESELPLHSSRLSADQDTWYTRLTWPRRVVRNLQTNKHMVIISHSQDRQKNGLGIKSVLKVTPDYIEIKRFGPIVLEVVLIVDQS